MEDAQMLAKIYGNSGREMYTHLYASNSGVWRPCVLLNNEEANRDRANVRFPRCGKKVQVARRRLIPYDHAQLDQAVKSGSGGC